MAPLPASGDASDARTPYLSIVPRASRLASIVLLLLHVAVAGLLPLADARAEATSALATATAHVEAQDGNRCPAVHDELTCQLCPLLRLAGQASARVALPPVARAVGGPALARIAHAASSASAAPDRARAPPAA